MKKITVLTIVGLMVLGLSAAAFANVASRLRVDVPFSFYVGKELLPAGQYIFETRSMSPWAASSSSVQIRNTSGDVMTWVHTQPGATAPQDDNHVHFNKYGNQYFLSKVEGFGYQATLNATRAEKELRAAVSKATAVKVAAK